MKLAYFACAIGRHKIDEKGVKHIHGADVGRCRHCRTPLEQVDTQMWEVQRVKDAGLRSRQFL